MNLGGSAERETCPWEVVALPQSNTFRTCVIARCPIQTLTLSGTLNLDFGEAVSTAKKKKIIKNLAKTILVMRKLFV